MPLNRLRGVCVGVVLLAFAQPAQAQRARPPAPPSALTSALGAATPELLGAVASFLGDSLLRARIPGSPGGALAAHFLAAQFQALGLRPGAANGTFLQPVPMLRVRARPSVVFGAGRETSTPKTPDDLVVWPLTTDSLISMDGEMVFAGYGIEAPEFGWDDYKGVPQTGRIVLILGGDPGLPDSGADAGRKRPRYGNWAYKLAQAAKMGAAGVIMVHSSNAATLSWQRLVAPLSGDHFWPDPAPAPTSLKFAGWIREDVVRALLKAAGRDYQLLVRRARQPEFSPLITGVQAAVDIDTDVTRIQGLNVVARLEGRDSGTIREPVVLAASYVRLGSDASFWRDSTPSSTDDCFGVAALVAAAAGASRLTPLPSRPLVFVATAGRPGAERFVAQSRDRTVATIHIEGAPVRGPAILAALGLDRSSLGDLALAAAQLDGTLLGPGTDSEAEFLASGAYPYATAASPALNLRADESPRTARLALRVALGLASSSQFPAWMPGMEPPSPNRKANPR